MAVTVIGVLTTADVGAVSATSIREETVRVRGVLAVVPPDAVPVMVSENDPAGVALVVVIAKVLVQGVAPGVQDAGVNEADAPLGSPDAEKVTASLVPPVLVAVMTLVLLVAAPCTTEISFSLVRVKVKGGVAVIVRSNAVVLPKGPLSVTVIGEVAVGVEAGTASVRVVSHDEPMVAGGVQDAGLIAAVTPVGRPVTLLVIKKTGAGVPELVVTCIV